MKLFPYVWQVFNNAISDCGGLVTIILLAACWQAPVQAQFVYDKEYPLMGYGKAAPTDRFSQVMAELAAHNQKLAYDPLGRGYLDALLKALGIDPSSQMLVFSKSSLKQRFISPENPRSLFFTDEVYVGYVPGSSSLEIAAMDPNLGSVFFDLSQKPDSPEPFKQETTRCLRCHDTYSMTGGGVPRFMLSSVISGADGNIVSHELSEITEPATPIEHRWGGWYVTGQSGQQIHLGNFIVKDVAQLSQRPWHGVNNQDNLAGFVDLKAYPRQTSDIVALLVLQHQVEVQNQVIRLNYESRKLLELKKQADKAQLEELLKPLLTALFMQDEAPLTDHFQGNSGYQEWFVQQGPKTKAGHSLREFDLQTRTFKYRLSYLIYSRAIEGLAVQVKQQLFAEIRAVLEGNSTLLPKSSLSADERSTIKAILQETKPEVLAVP